MKAKNTISSEQFKFTRQNCRNRGQKSVGVKL